MDILNKIQQNSNVPTRCYNTAVTSDIIFKEIASINNIIYTKSSIDTDIYDHIDYYCKFDDKTFTIDIKSAKKFLNNDYDYTKLLEDWVWVELKNVNGYNGWLFGKANYIVLVFLSELWFINRHKLVTFIKNNVNMKYVTNKNDAMYNLYKRLRRNDLLTLIQLKDIKNHLNPKIFQKTLDNI